MKMMIEGQCPYGECVRHPGLGLITLSFAKYTEREGRIRCPVCGRRKKPKARMCKVCNLHIKYSGKGGYHGQNT